MVVVKDGKGCRICIFFSRQRRHNKFQRELSSDGVSSRLRLDKEKGSEAQGFGPFFLVACDTNEAIDVAPASGQQSPAKGPLAVVRI